MSDVPKAERLVNLVIALLEARKPMTLAEIKRRTGYYSDGSETSARRKFERDKDELRQLGVPIETRPSDAFGVSDGYNIDRHSYEQPDVELTPDEAAALALVVRMTAEPEARLAMTRFSARATGSGAKLMNEADAGIGARLVLGDGPFASFAQAVIERRAVTFHYRRGDGTQGERTVDPYAVLSRGGAWYIVGHDHDRADVRAFRLDRLQGSPQTAGERGTYQIPDGFDPRPHVSGPVVPTHGVQIAVAESSSWEAQSRGGQPTKEKIDGLVVHDFGTADHHRLATWAVGMGDRAVVLSPPELRADVVARLQSLLGESS
ncbi:MAG: proteasome accessory factor B [Glaciecola sp.]